MKAIKKVKHIKIKLAYPLITNAFIYSGKETTGELSIKYFVRLGEEIMPWQYSQSTGKLYHNGTYVTTGYSGYGTARNNPTMEGAANLGPIPAGKYSIGTPQDSRQTGPHVLPLTPIGHNALGRHSFQIHGDNRTNDASTGCIIMPRNVRERITSSADNILEVTY